MTTKKTVVVTVALIAGLAAGGMALAQSMQHGGSGMHGQMHSSMHGRSGMHGQMHSSMHGSKGGMHEGMHGGQGHGGSGHGRNQTSGDQSASSLAFAAVNEKMHRDMAITFSGNPDVDFVRGMIPHHQGAIDMAKIVVAFGKDPEIRKLAEEIVKAQESEINFMQSWLQKRGQ
jgi:uncharacterized protein (DUF305 family)